MMPKKNLIKKLDELLKLPHETEWAEFKEAKNDFSSKEMGQYFSALSNEANLRGQSCGWLVLGVRKDHSVCGTSYRKDAAKLDNLKHEIAQQTTGGMTFREIHVVDHPDGRVIMFEIPPAPIGIPIAFKGHYYGRDGESLVALSLNKLEQIRSQIMDDWSAVICPKASVLDLDPGAMKVARRSFLAKNKNQPFGNEIEAWPDEIFLEKARLTKSGEVTRACLILLGRKESAFLLEPYVAEITWRLENDEQAYEHFGPPFLLTTNEVYNRIRNPNQKIDVPNQLIPYEIAKYEKWVILEALNNAIAHQDYRRQARIVVTETHDYLLFESAGSFFEGTIADYTLAQKTPQRYRNRFLAEAMVNLNMIDRMGYGIHRMYQEQKRRFYPLPDFDLTDPESVKVTIHGKVIDPNYTALLMEKKELPLRLVILLDQVQKRQGISKDDAKMLRRQKLVEGRYPNIYVASHLAISTDKKAQYIKNRAFDDAHYKDLVIQYLRKYGEASRQDIDALLMDKLSNVLSREQKENKIRNLLHQMSKQDRSIRNIGAGRRSIWVLNLDKKDVS